MNKLIRGLSERLMHTMQALADQHKRSLNSEVIWALEQYVTQERTVSKMKFDSKDGNYHGMLPDGTEIIVDGDVYTEQEQAGLSASDLASPLVWENSADGVDVRIVEKK